MPPRSQAHPFKKAQNCSCQLLFKIMRASFYWIKEIILDELSIIFCVKTFVVKRSNTISYAIFPQIASYKSKKNLIGLFYRHLKLVISFIIINRAKKDS